MSGGLGLGGGVVHEQVVGFDPDIREFPEHCPVHLVVTADHLASLRQSHRLAHHELSQLPVLHLEALALHKRRLAADRVQHKVQGLGGESRGHFVGSHHVYSYQLGGVGLIEVEITLEVDFDFVGSGTLVGEVEDWVVEPFASSLKYLHG